jgi:hypothetical protein
MRLWELSILSLRFFTGNVNALTRRPIVSFREVWGGLYTWRWCAMGVAEYDIWERGS